MGKADWQRKYYTPRRFSRTKHLVPQFTSGIFHCEYLINSLIGFFIGPAAAFDSYHMQDENGLWSGYGYEMMQGIAKYMQCTFSYVGYDKTAKECEEMLQNGEADIYTAAKKIPEREEEFAFSRHPAITAFTSMNVETPNWRSDLYNKYYGSVEVNTDYTAEEKALLSQLKESGAVIRGVMNPDGNQYSWYENGEAKGIAAARCVGKTAENSGNRRWCDGQRNPEQ